MSSINRPRTLRKIKNQAKVSDFLACYKHLEVDKDGFFRCGLCQSWIDGDRHDIERHFGGRRHRKREKTISGMASISELVQRSGREPIPSVMSCFEVLLNHGVGAYP